MSAEELFTPTQTNHPTYLNRLIRGGVSIFIGAGLGLVAGYLASGLVDGFALLGSGVAAGIMAGIGVGIGLTRFEQLTAALLLGMVGYVVLGMIGYAVLFGLIGLFVGGGQGWSVGVVLGAVLGTAVGVYAYLIKYRYRHF